MDGGEGRIFGSISEVLLAYAAGDVETPLNAAKDCLGSARYKRGCAHVDQDGKHEEPQPFLLGAKGREPIVADTTLTVRDEDDD